MANNVEILELDVDTECLTIAITSRNKNEYANSITYVVKSYFTRYKKKEDLISELSKLFNLISKGELIGKNFSVNKCGYEIENFKLENLFNHLVGDDRGCESVRV